MLGSNELGIGDLLEALSRECATLASVSERIQTIVVCAAGVAGTERSFHRDAQACDLLTQSLTAITDFLATISQRVPRSWTLDVVDALKQLPLSDLAAVLALEPKPTPEESPGAIDFF